MTWFDNYEENLQQAAEDGDYERALKYINKGAILSNRGGCQWTALHSAASNGHERIAKLLLDKGANVHDRDNTGDTALHSAAYRGRENVVKLLLDRGANVHDKNSQGNTALHWAAEYGYGNVVQLLLGRGAKIDERNNEGETALDLARSGGELGVVEILNSYKPPKPPKAHKPAETRPNASTAVPISPDNRVLMDTLIEIACNQVEPSLVLLKQKIKPENVVSVAALLAGHNIVLIALRGGLLKQPYSTFDNDLDWFKDKLYHPIYDKVKSWEEREMVMKVATHAESMGIIRNSFDIRQSIIINDKIERRMETVGTVIADIYQHINKIEAGLNDVTQHSISIGQGLRQFHQAYQKKRKMDRISGLLRLVTSAIPFAATAVGETVGLGVELLLMGVEEVANQAIEQFTNVDLADFRVAQWVVSENYQKCLPDHVRALFEREVQQTFGGMRELECCLYEMMKDSNVTPLRISRRNVTIPSVPQQYYYVSESVPKFTDFGSKRVSSSYAANEANIFVAANASAPCAGVAEWTAEYNKYLSGFGESDLSLEDAMALTSELSGKDEAKCESVLRQVDKGNTGRFSRMRFVLAMERLCLN